MCVWWPRRIHRVGSGDVRGLLARVTGRAQRQTAVEGTASMSNHDELQQIADIVSENDPALACRLRALAARVRQQERCLDELVDEDRISTRLAESVAVEHLARYRRAR